MNKQQLAAKIWDAANKMRSKIEANEYKDYILGFIFYRYLSEGEERFLLEQGYPKEKWEEIVTAENEETANHVKGRIGYYIPYRYLFSTWRGQGNDFDVSAVNVGLQSFARNINPTHQAVFEKIFDTLGRGLPKLGENTAAQTKAVKKLLDLIADIPMDDKQDYDVLGYIYEFLISQFAANAGKKAGEFYTPHEVSLLMSEIVADHLKDRETISIYDSASGSGSLLINIGRAMSKYILPNKISYYAQELKENTYNLTRMNLVMRGIAPSNISTRNADTLEEDWPLETNGVFSPLRVDAIVSNPPYSQNWDPADKETDPRFADFGMAPKSKADYAFLLHDLYHLKHDGVMCIVLPHGVLFRGGEEGAIRRNLVEKGHIHAIIGLPANIFFGTGIPTIIMVLRRNRTESDILIVDASKGFEKEGKNNKLRACDIRRIRDAVTGRLDIDRFSRRVSLQEIRANDYNLNIPRYVDSSEPAESYDIYAAMFGGIPPAELESLAPYWETLPGLRDALFSQAANGYSTVTMQDVTEIIRSHPSVAAFKDSFSAAFRPLAATLESQLVSNVQVVRPAQLAEELSADVITRAEKLPLTDKYAVYQLFSEAWTKISGDLEIIRTEGFGQAVRQVDPNMVVKKKDGKEVEVQDGWVGHILPFEVVQRLFLSDELAAAQALLRRQDEVDAELDDLINELDDDEKGQLLNDDNEAFVPKEVAKRIKEFKLPSSPEEVQYLQHAKTADSLLKERTKLKKEIKNAEEQLVMRTRHCIENLSDDEVHDALVEKWVTPFMSALSDIPETLIADLITRIRSLVSKYETPLPDLQQEIDQTEAQLAEMLGDLTGSDVDMSGIRELQNLLKGL